MKKLYRLLHPLENPLEGLSAKNPAADVSVEKHVGSGSSSGIKSQYISTSATYRGVYNLVKRTKKWRVRVVRIDLEKLQRIGEISIVDLTKSYLRREHLNKKNSRKFARQYTEVLVIGYIPASCVELIYEGTKRDIPKEEPEVEDSTDDEEEDGCYDDYSFSDVTSDSDEYVEYGYSYSGYHGNSGLCYDSDEVYGFDYY
ncbi:hypothetical protein FSP39_019147 [Pinctada imbricata]|uniref:DUF7587 domain-containing protein n=1 Tax=Pinctada imbricata TaxID=66713 RepID=A0AA88YE22_PINIB|nr:hypothetical protein FSP39_019147 [Pinctada imbricata]